MNMIVESSSVQYPYIVIWETWIGHPELTLTKSIQHAIETGAPQDACFYLDGKWVTYSEITNQQTLHYLKKTANLLKSKGAI